MLVSMDLVPAHIVAQLLYRFDQLDSDGTGRLDRADLILLSVKPSALNGAAGEGESGSANFV